MYSTDQVLFYGENLVRIVYASSDKLWKIEPDMMVLPAFPGYTILSLCLFKASQPHHCPINRCGLLFLLSR